MVTEKPHRPFERLLRNKPQLRLRSQHTFYQLTTMSDDAPGPEIQINVKGASVAPPCSLETDDVNNPLGPSELKLQISITTDKTVERCRVTRMHVDAEQGCGKD